MTIAAQTNRTHIDGNGITTNIPINFPFDSQDDLVVVSTITSSGAETVKVLNSDYTIVGTPDGTGRYPNGTVVMSPAPATGIRVTVYRDPPVTQQVDLLQTGNLPVETAVESPLDKLTMIAIRHKELLARSLRQPEGDAGAVAAIPPKAVRASRYLGFDGDGNPTMMQTPTGMLTGIAQLTESTAGNLPAPGAAGSLRKVTDGSRGVWMDTGLLWFQLTADRFNVKDFGAKGDGVTDDTAAIQAAITAVPSYGGIVVFPAPTVAYRVTSTITINKDFICLEGVGRSTVRISSEVVGDPTFLYNSESLHNYISGLWLEGNGETDPLLGNGHAIAFIDPTPDTGAYAPQLSNVFNCRISGFRGEDTDGRGGTMLACGIMQVSTLSVKIADCFIENCGINIHIDTCFTARVYDTLCIGATHYGIQAIGRTGIIENMFVFGGDILNNGDGSTVAQIGWATAPTGNLYMHNVRGSAILGTKFKTGSDANVVLAYSNGVKIAGCSIRADNQDGVIIRVCNGVTLDGIEFDCSVGSTHTPTYVTIQAVGGQDCFGIKIQGCHFRFQGNINIADIIRIEGDASARKVSGSIEDCAVGDIDLVGPVTIDNIITVEQATLYSFAIKRVTTYIKANATVTCGFRTDLNTNFEKFTYEDVSFFVDGGTLGDDRLIAVGGFRESLSGRGDPNGVVKSYPGSDYRDLDGGAGATLWIKESGNWTDTGWVAK